MTRKPDPPCATPACTRPGVCDGYCTRCYTGCPPHYPDVTATRRGECYVEDCTAIQHGEVIWCLPHYSQWVTAGNRWAILRQCNAVDCLAPVGPTSPVLCPRHLAAAQDKIRNILGRL